MVWQECDNIHEWLGEYLAKNSRWTCLKKCLPYLHSGECFHWFRLICYLKYRPYWKLNWRTDKKMYVNPWCRWNSIFGSGKYFINWMPLTNFSGLSFNLEIVWERVSRLQECQRKDCFFHIISVCCLNCLFVQRTYEFVCELYGMIVILFAIETDVNFTWMILILYSSLFVVLLLSEELWSYLLSGKQ